MPLRSPKPAAPPPPLAKGALPATRESYMQAAKHFGTPNPSHQQQAQFALQQQNAPLESGQGDTEKNRTVGDLMKNLAGLGGAVGLAKVALADWSKGVEEAAAKLKDFSPAVGQAKAKFDIAELKRTYKEARETGGSTSALLEARSNRMDAIAPLQNSMTNFGNVLRAGVTNFQTRLFQFFDDMGIDDALDYITDFVAWWWGVEKADDKDQRFQGQFKDFLKNIGHQPESPRPQGFGGGGGR